MKAEIDAESFGRQLGEVIKFALKPLEARVAALEGSAVSKSLDAEAFDELAGMAERLSQIESRGLQYLGGYQPACSYTQGQIVSFRGGLWYCNAGAEPAESPDTKRTKWTKMLSGEKFHVE